MNPEIAHKITDLRRRVLENERAGKPAHDGISPEEYREAIEYLRGHRADAGAKGGKAAAAAKATKKAAEPKQSSAALANLLADLGD